MANEFVLDDAILAAIKAGATTRAKLMEIEQLRLKTWAVIGERVNILTKRRTLISSKTGWRIA